jgi:hypothetical protein
MSLTNMFGIFTATLHLRLIIRLRKRFFFTSTIRGWSVACVIELERGVREEL